MFKKLLYAFLILFAIGTASFAAVTYPVSLAISPKDMFTAPGNEVGYIYVPDTLSGSSRLYIRKIYNDTTAPSIPASLPSGYVSLPGQPLGVAVSPDGEKVYVAISSGATQSIKVYSKDGIAEAVDITFAGFRGLRGLAVSPDGKRLYAADSIANKVHVIDTVSKIAIDVDPSTPAIDGINIPVASDVYSVAVSPDNALLAVTRKTTSGSLFVYRIDRELDGTITYPLLWSKTPETGTGLYYPNYPIFSPDSKRLYVRVHELSGSYNDVYVYENPNSASLPTRRSIRVPYDIATSEAYAGNNRGGEAMTLSSNGQYLYFIHFRVWNTVAKPVEARFYRVSNLNADGSLRTDYSEFLSPTNPSLSLSLNEGLMYSTTPGTPTPYDGMAASPDGSRVWYSCSEGGSYASLRFTGFTAYPSGVLTNAIPGAPGIVHPASASGDNLNNYTSGVVEWTPGADDSLSSDYHFEVSYKRISSSTWTTPSDMAWLSSGARSVTLPSSLSYNQWYVVQVRMHDGTYWSDPAFSELFKKSFPLVTSIEVDTDRSPTVSNWQGYDSATNIGYIYDTIKLKGSGFGTVDQPWLNGDGDHNQIQFGIPDKFGNYYYMVIPGQEGTNRRILSWTDTEIIMIVPRAFKDGTVFKANNVRVKVKTNDLLSTFKAFRVGPVITNMAPVSGLAGDAMVTITGAGFGGVTGTDDVYFFDNQLVTIASRTSGADYEQFTVPVPATATTGRVIVRANSIDSSANYQGSPHGTYNEPVIFTVTGVAVQNVAVTSPNGGETLTAGSTANITWTSSGITNVKIRYSANGGLHWADVVTSTPAAAGTFTWTPVPSTPTTQGRVEVSDAGDSSPLDTSDANFTIQEGGTPSILIDDFEGGSVDPATGYYGMGTPPPTYSRITTDIHGGTYGMQTSYAAAVDGWRGWGGVLRSSRNLSSYDTISFWAKRNNTNASDNKIKIQFKDADGTNMSTSDLRAISLTDVPTDRFVEFRVPVSDISNRTGTTGDAAMDWSRIIEYQVVFAGTSASPGNIYVDDVTAITSTVGPGSTSFTLYHLETGNENWISTPFAITPAMDNTVELGQAIAASFAPGEGDNITIRKWDNSAQTAVTTSGDYVGGTWLWDPADGYPVTAGEMFESNVSRAAGAPFSTTLNLSGDIPAAGLVQFTLYHLDTGNENWMSIPYNRADINSTLLLGQSIASTYTAGEGDNITIKKWDNSTQTAVTTSGDYVGGTWLWDPPAGVPSNSGYPYLINIRREAGAPFNATTRF